MLDFLKKTFPPALISSITADWVWHVGNHGRLQEAQSLPQGSDRDAGTGQMILVNGATEVSKERPVLQKSIIKEPK